ncbi:MAG: tRNA-dihydrouridine synthase [Candidatus Pacebacteria bacterium]|nr:tRNA-dihydrouridine synthase [Candidatus Paceibacterota bacterium]
MSKNFIEKLKDKKNIIALAPMADVTDLVFRELIAKYSRPQGPDIFWTEFVAADGLVHKDAQKKLLIDLKFSKKERPILAQIFGSNKENMLKATTLVHKLGFDGVDINMGCPDKSIEKQGSGASMIKNPNAVRDLLKDLKKEITKLNKKSFFSFSVKTRIGYNKIEYKTWFPNILDFEPDIFTIHLRTRKEMSLVEAHYEISKEIVDFIKKYCIENKLKTPLIILNGDVKNIKDAIEKIKISNADGIMIGRGVFGTPWLFNDKEYENRSEQNIETKKGKENILFKLKVMLEHTKNFENKLVKEKSFNIMKKHYKAYVNGFDNAKELRIELMNAKDYKEIKKITDNFIKEKLK